MERVYLIMAIELAMQLLRSGAAGGSSGFRSGKVAKIFSFSSHVNVCAIAISTLRHASKATCVGAFASAVDAVLRTCSEPQIGPAIIRWVKVTVVNLVRWPVTRHDQPDQPVSEVQAASGCDLDRDLSVGSPCSCRLTNPSYARRLLPRQNPGFGVVIEQAAHELRREIVARVFLSHPGIIHRE